MIIREMEQRDADEVLAMMRVFYHSPAVLHKASDEVLRRDIQACLGQPQTVRGFVFDVDGAYAGYAMTVCGFSTEYGGICLWVEDLYIRPEYRGQKISKLFFEALEARYPDTAVRIRLEVEAENERAISVYTAAGFTPNEYIVMNCNVE